MIVQPDFVEHWKSRQLVNLTGDESALLAVLRLWTHCQHSKRSEFPHMTPAQLASVCHWGSRKPACHVALVKAGFVDRLSPRGFAAHQWSEHNAQLIQKWNAGAKGGRPAKDESGSESGERVEPTDNRPITGTEPDRPDKTRQDQIEKNDRADSAQRLPAVAGRKEDDQAPKVWEGTDWASIEGGQAGAVEGLAGEIAKSLRASSKPRDIEELRLFLSLEFKGAERWADATWKALQKGKGRDGQPIQDWRAFARNYASVCERNKRSR